MSYDDINQCMQDPLFPEITQISWLVFDLKKLKVEEKRCFKIKSTSLSAAPSEVVLGHSTLDEALGKVRPLTHYNNFSSK